MPWQTTGFVVLPLIQRSCILSIPFKTFSFFSQNLLFVLKRQFPQCCFPSETYLLYFPFPISKRQECSKSFQPNSQNSVCLATEQFFQALSLSTSSTKPKAVLSFLHQAVLLPLFVHLIPLPLHPSSTECWDVMTK